MRIRWEWPSTHEALAGRRAALWLMRSRIRWQKRPRPWQCCLRGVPIRIVVDQGLVGVRICRCDAALTDDVRSVAVRNAWPKPNRLQVPTSDRYVRRLSRHRRNATQNPRRHSSVFGPVRTLGQATPGEACRYSSSWLISQIVIGACGEMASASPMTRHITIYNQTVGGEPQQVN